MEYFSYKKIHSTNDLEKQTEEQIRRICSFPLNYWGVLITFSSNHGKVVKQKSPHKNLQIFLLDAQIDGSNFAFIME